MADQDDKDHTRDYVIVRSEQFQRDLDRAQTLSMAAFVFGLVSLILVIAVLLR